MASVKNLKSKGRASPHEYSDYDYRKQQFADLPPATMVRPLRAVRGMYQQALSVWHRAVTKGFTPDYPHGAEQLYKAARRAAAGGQGSLVRLLARA